MYRYGLAIWRSGVRSICEVVAIFSKMYVCEREWLSEIKNFGEYKKNRAPGKRNQINIGNCVFCARLKPLLSGRALSTLKSRKMAVIYYDKRKSYKCFFPPCVNSNGKKKNTRKLRNIFFCTFLLLSSHRPSIPKRWHSLKVENCVNR